MNILVENGFCDSPSFHEIILGISSIDNNIYLLSDVKDITPNEKAIIVIPFSKQWHDYTVSLLLSQKIHPIIIMDSYDDYFSSSSCITYDSLHSFYELTNSLIPYTNKNFAFVGISPDSTPDFQKYIGFRNALKEHNIKFEKDFVFYNKEDFTTCANNFLKQYEKFDSIICCNDLVAILILSKIPNPLNFNITGFGGTKTGEFTLPSLTTIQVDYYHIGKEAVLLYQKLLKTNVLSKTIITVKNDFVIRESTPHLKKIDVKYPTIKIDSNELVNTNMYSNCTTKDICSFEALFKKCDMQDLQILIGLREKKSYETIAADCFLSLNAMKNRIKNYQKLTNSNTVEDLRALLNFYNIPNYHN